MKQYIYSGKIFAVLACILVVSTAGFGQFTTPTVDGVIGTNEYGVHVDGQNQGTSGSQVWYMTWDNTNLYVAVTSATTSEAAVLYLDKDPQAPINGGSFSNGTNVGFNYDGTSFTALQFRADLVLYFKDSYREYRTADGSNGWSGASSPFGTYASAGTTRELAIPWSLIGGRPATFAWFGYVTSSGGFVYGSIPPENAGGAIGTNAMYERYYVINSTLSGSSVKPFSRDSYVFNRTTDATNFGAANVYDFTMNSPGRTITRTGGTWTIGGDLRIDAGTISFGSISDAATVAGNLVIGTSSTLTGSVTSGADLTITGSISLANTNIVLNASNITLGGTVSGAGATNCIVTNSTGTLAHSIAASGSFTFPIGPTTSSYNPLTISLAPGDPTETFNVRVQSILNPASLDNSSCVQRTWNITEATPGGNHATLKFQWRASEQGGNLTNVSNMSAYRYDSGISQYVAMSALGVTGSDPYVGTMITSTGTFSPWILGNTAALPIQLSSFSAAAVEGNRVRLDWSTLSEVNNYGFYVQRRSADETTWTEVDNSFIAGHGTTNLPQRYSFTDAPASSGAWYYRLKQVDIDGAVHLSDPVQVNLLTSVAATAPRQFALFQNYPNPFNPSTEIKFSVESTSRSTLELYNMLGQKVATLFDGVAEAGQFYKITLNASNLASGMYLYKLQSGSRTDLKKMVLLK